MHLVQSPTSNISVLYLLTYLLFSYKWKYILQPVLNLSCIGRWQYSSGHSNQAKTFHAHSLSLIKSNLFPSQNTSILQQTVPKSSNCWPSGQIFTILSQSITKIRRQRVFMGVSIRIFHSSRGWRHPGRAGPNFCCQILSLETIINDLSTSFKNKNSVYALSVLQITLKHIIGVKIGQIFICLFLVSSILYTWITVACILHA